MFRRGRGTFFAIGLALGAGISLFFLVWAVPEFRSPNLAKGYYENWQAAPDNYQIHNPDEPHFWVRELHGWVFAEDSLAQWLMAALGFAATAISLCALIWLRRTWDQTRSAANAAWKAVDVTREIGQAQVRAYVGITGGTVKLVHASPGMTDQRVRPKISINVKNYGQSPALWFQWSVIARYYPTMHRPFLGSLEFPPESWGKDIGCNEEPSFTKNIGSAPLDEGAMMTLTRDEFHMDFVIRYAFRDVFDKRIEDERIFTAYVPKNGIDIEVPLIPHVLDRQTIESLIEVNSPENIARFDESIRRIGQKEEG